MLTTKQIWLAGLKIGDEVVISGFTFGSQKIAKVTKATACFFDAGGYTFNRKTGSQTSHGSKYANMPSEKLLKSVKDEDDENHMRARIRDLGAKCRSLPLPAIRAMLNAYDAHTKSTNKSDIEIGEK